MSQAVEQCGLGPEPEESGIESPPIPTATELGLPVAVLNALPYYESVPKMGFKSGKPVKAKSLTELPTPSRRVVLGSNEEQQQPTLIRDATPSTAPVTDATLPIANAVDIVDSLFKPHRVTFSLRIPYQKGCPRGLGLGLRELPAGHGGGALLVHALRRGGAGAGAGVGRAEAAGVCLGDVLLGIGYEPVGNGLEWLSEKVSSAEGGCLTFQLSRDLSIMPVLPPVPTNQTASRVLHRATELHRSGALPLAGKMGAASCGEARGAALPLPPLATQGGKMDGRRRLHALTLRLLALADTDHSGGVSAVVTEGLANGRPNASAPPHLKSKDEGAVAMAYLLGLGAGREEIPANMEDPRSLAAWARGLRPALSVRALSARVGGGGAVAYAFWVEDVATGRAWKVTRRFSDCRALQVRLVALVPALAEVYFPRRRLAMKAVISRAEIVEQRIGYLEAFLRRCLWLCMGALLDGPAPGAALGVLEEFLGVGEHLHPGPGTGRYGAAPGVGPGAAKLIELHAFKVLEGNTDTALLVRSLRESFDAEAIALSGREARAAALSAAAAGEEGGTGTLEEGDSWGRPPKLVPPHRAVLEEMGARLEQLERFLGRAHAAELTAEARRRAREAQAAAVGSRTAGPVPAAGEPGAGLEPAAAAAAAAAQAEADAEAEADLIRRAVRRQAEAALFLPLKRQLHRTVALYLGPAARRLDAVVRELRESCPAERFLVPRGLRRCPGWPAALRAFRACAGCLLPCDKVAALVRAAEAVVRLHRECCARAWEQAGPAAAKNGLLPTGGSGGDSMLRRGRDDTFTGGTSDESSGSSAEDSSSDSSDCDDDSGTGSSADSEGVEIIEGEGALHSGWELESVQRAALAGEDGMEMRPVVEGPDPLADYSSFNMEGLREAAAAAGAGSAVTSPRGGAATPVEGPPAQTEGGEGGDAGPAATAAAEKKKAAEVQWMSADDFLPIFTFVLVHAAPPQLLLLAEHARHLLDPAEAVRERGYYVATLEAAVHLVVEVHRQLRADGGEGEGGGGGGGGGGGQMKGGGS